MLAQSEAKIEISEPKCDTVPFKANMYIVCVTKCAETQTHATTNTQLSYFDFFYCGNIHITKFATESLLGVQFGGFSSIRNVV